jgi:hypothetical protein
MAGPVPAIHALFDNQTKEGVDARHEAGHDDKIHIQESYS